MDETEKLGFRDRLSHAWNAFRNKDPGMYPYGFTGSLSVKPADYIGAGSYIRPDHVRLTYGQAETFIAAVYNRIATDCASVKIEHVRVNENDQYVEPINSGLNYCLTYEPNIDQTSRMFISDVVLNMLDHGIVGIVPVDTTLNPANTASYDINTMRACRIIQWYPRYVQIQVYNDATGQKEQLTVPKNMVAIIENPFYAVMNETNSTLKRLSRKLALLDQSDEANSAQKLDLIIQLPYVIKSEARKQQAEVRRTDIERQLSQGPYGIAYTDGTERITQLNRPVTNNLLDEVKNLTETLYGQLGLTPEILNGTAPESAMINYYKRTIDPILYAICDEMERKFLTRTARTQRQAIKFYRDPFSLATTDGIAELADKLTRNEVLSSNEVRAVIGFKPSEDPAANELRNKNLNQSVEDIEAKKQLYNEEEEGDYQNGV